MENNKFKLENASPLPEYLKGLSEEDIRLINKQCELQGATSKDQVEGFAKAYKEASDLVVDVEGFKKLSGDGIENLILHFAALIDKRNEKGYRKVPVTFKGGSTALKPELIERAMQSFCQLYAEGNMEPMEAYTEFEKIHPFEDGNGRLGDLLWKMAMKRKHGEWPEELPPDVFGNLK